MRQSGSFLFRCLARFSLAAIVSLLVVATAFADFSSTAPRTFVGTVYYQPESGEWRGVSGVTVQLWGNMGRDIWSLLDATTTGRGGTFDLTSDQFALSYRVVKEDPRGYTPASAYGGYGGTTIDPSTLSYASSALSAAGLNFVLVDPIPPLTYIRGHYLIVTSQAIADSDALATFIAYKTSLGFAMHVVSVEELDPTGLGANYLRDRIRDYEKGMLVEHGLDYVLLIGSNDTIPFMTYNPGGPDLSRYDPSNPAFLEGGYPDACSAFSQAPNNCGWAGDWFYVDLTSDWDTNGDGIYAEGIWADPDALQTWFDAGILPDNAPSGPAAYIPDQPPAFQVDVALGRLPIDSAQTVQRVLHHIIAFEQDGGEWKSRAVLAGAMMALGGKAWEPADDFYHGHWENLPEATDTGYLMEHVYADILEPAGFERVSLYEQQSANGVPPSTLGPQVPLTHENLIAEWTAQSAGLVKLAGHGSVEVVVRTYWEDDSNGDGQIQNPSRPPDQWDDAEWEIGELAYIERNDVLEMPASKQPVLMAMACSTGSWADASNLGANLLARGRISAWIGGTSTVNYLPGWEHPYDGAGQTIDYLITEGIFADKLPLGEAVWQGLNRFKVQHGASWGGGDWDLGFVNYDLYGDPSMQYWGNASSRATAWPMQGLDWAASGETTLLGPAPSSGSLVDVRWESGIASTPESQRLPSPVVGRTSNVIIGDANGVVRCFAGGVQLWSYSTGGAIVNAAALSGDGTIYVKSRDGGLYALTDTGALCWSRQVGEGDGSPRVGANGLIYVGGSESDGLGGTRYLLLAYDANGNRVGSAELDGPATSSAAIDLYDRVYVGTSTGRVYRCSADLSEASGRMVSEDYAIGSGLAIPPLSYDVLVPSASGQLFCLGQATLMTDWAVDLGSPLRGAPAVTSDGIVYCGTSAGRMAAYEIATGDSVWNVDLGGAIEGAPALDPVNLFVVAGDPAEVVAIKRGTGETVWRLPLGGSPALASSPAIGPGRGLYVAGRTSEGLPSGALVCFGLNNWAPHPDILTVDPRPEEIIVDLRVSDPFSQVRIESRLAGGDWGLETVLAPGVTQYADTSFAAGQQVAYRAQSIPVAVDLASDITAATEPSEYSPSATVMALPTVPTTPPAPTVSTVSSSALCLSWTAVDMAADTLHVLRRAPGEATYQEVAALSAGVLDYVDRDLLSQSTYSYRLRLTNESGQSAVSDAAQGTTRGSTLPPPSSLTVAAVSNAVFDLSWAPASASYRTVVARQAEGQVGPQVLADLDPGVTAYTDHVAAPYAFGYWLKHVDAGGINESLWVHSSAVPAPAFVDEMPTHTLWLPLNRRG